MSRTIEALEGHIASRPRQAGPPVRSKTRLATASLSIGRPGELGLQPSAPSLIAEWQQRGPETLSGYTLGKLRLALAPTQSVMTPTPVGAG